MRKRPLASESGASGLVRDGAASLRPEMPVGFGGLHESVGLSSRSPVCPLAVLESGWLLGIV